MGLPQLFFWDAQKESFFLRSIGFRRLKPTKHRSSWNICRSSQSERTDRNRSPSQPQRLRNAARSVYPAEKGDGKEVTCKKSSSSTDGFGRITRHKCVAQIDPIASQHCIRSRLAMDTSRRTFAAVTIGRKRREPDVQTTEGLQLVRYPDRPDAGP